MITNSVPHDLYQHRNRKGGKFVPITTWHWVSGSDADEDPPSGQTPHPAAVDSVLPLTTPVPTYTAHAPQHHSSSNLLNFNQYGGDPAPSTSALYDSAFTQAYGQSHHRPLNQSDLIQLPDYSQAFPTLTSSSFPIEAPYNPITAYEADNSVLPYRASPTDTTDPLSVWPSAVSGVYEAPIDHFHRSQLPPDTGTVWDGGIGPLALDQLPSTQPIVPFEDSPNYSEIVNTLLANIDDVGDIGNANDEERIDESISPFLQSAASTENVSPDTNITTPDQEPPRDNRNASKSGAAGASRKRARSPGAVHSKEIIQHKRGEIQGMNMVWQGQKPPDHTLDEDQKADRKRRMKLGTCSRCKRLKKRCIGFKDSPYLPCESCRTSNPTTITSACVLEASLLNIMLFRMGPPVDNPTFPLNFFSHRQDIFYSVTDGADTSDTLELELMQDDIGHVLNLTVSRFNPLDDDKLAYEGTGENGPYKLDMPPYCISDINKARESLVAYMRKSKSAYFNRLVDRSNALLFNTFKMAAMCDFSKRPLVNKALDIWAATRLIERTWKLCGKETFGIHPFKKRTDPWKGFVPVTPIMDQQLDQVVIREVLVPRRNQLLNQLKTKVYTESNRQLHAFEVYMTFFILINNAEMQIAAEREFAQRYGFSGRFGPRGKYMDAEAQFHAARTMLGHFHYICRANSLLTTSPKLLGELGVADKEREYLEFVRKQTELQKQHFATLVQEHRYETAMYFCHQMLLDEWNPGLGHIEELPEMMVAEILAVA